MNKINFLELLFWTFRRNEKDVIHLYDSLSDVMRSITGGNMLNFGLWTDAISSPLEAQKNLCNLFGTMAKLKSEQRVMDVGSGFAAPAIYWYNDYKPLDIVCVNLNYQQQSESQKQISNMNITNYFDFFATTATRLPFHEESFDRIIAFESAQHFKPLNDFLIQSYKILKKGGLFAMAIPIVNEEHNSSFLKLGMLSITWSSEHYSFDFLFSLLNKSGFRILEHKTIGMDVYEPLANYYIKNRESIKKKISTQYPKYVENILYKSILKMKDVSEKKIIDYLLIVCEK